MSEDKNEEETYSHIFNTLKHPIRRRIIRRLSDKPKTYFEILHELSIDSGHLSYHLESLGDIVTRTKTGKYTLSSVGQAAVNLMAKVEAQHATAKAVKQAQRISKTALLFSTIFAIALLTATAYSLEFTTQQQTTFFEVSQIPVNLQPNQTYTYTITLTALSFISDGHGYIIGNNTTEVIFPQPTKTVTEWTQLVSNTTLLLNGTFTTSITIRDPDQNVLYQNQVEGNDSSTLSLTLGFEFTKSGNYSILIENFGDACSETLVPQGNQITYQRPLISWGLAGTIILLLYPLLLLLVRKRSGAARRA